MKRTKRVFASSSQIFHLWANQAQSDARQGGNLTRASFEGTSCYSYQARIGEITTYRGVRVGVVNFQRYSNTTRKHQNEAWDALRGLMPRVQSDNFDVKKGLLETQGKLVDRLMGIFSSRRPYFKGWKLLGREDYSFKDHIQEFNETCKALKHPELTIDVTEEFIQLASDHNAACRIRQSELDATKEERRLKRQAEEMKKNAESAEAWRRGGPATNFVRSMRPQILRVATVGSGGPFEAKLVETSGGAEVPLDQALRLLKAVERGVAKAGTKVGEFTFEHVQGGIAKIGCHLIALDEAKRVLEGTK